LIKIVVMGVWVCIVALGTVFGVVMWHNSDSQASSDGKKAKTEKFKTRMISVPLLVGNEVQGYVVARFEFTVDSEHLKSSAVGPDSFVADEAFKAIYGDVSKDFRVVRKQDLKALTADIVAGVNKRLGLELIHDVMIDSWSYLSKQDMENDNEHSKH
jgi:flagellar basal body-associated protein FliL